MIAAVSAARADDPADVGALEHLFQFLRSTRFVSGEVQISFKDRFKIKSLVAQFMKSGATGFKLIAPDMTGRRNDSQCLVRIGLRYGGNCAGGLSWLTHSFKLQPMKRTRPRR